MQDFINTFVYFTAVVGLSCSNLSYEYFGRRFNQQPTTIIDLPEPSDTGKILRGFYMDMKNLAIREILLKGKDGGEPWLHKPFLKGHLVDGVAR